MKKILVLKIGIEFKISTESIMNISVIIPATGECEYLLEAINSALLQNYPAEFEIIVVIQSVPSEIVARLSELNYKNILTVYDPGNTIVSALNLGLKNAKYDWIARLDSDDLMASGRIEKQTNFLQNNSEYLLVGGQAQVIDVYGKQIKVARYPINDYAIKFGLSVQSTLPHPGVLIKKKILQDLGGYTLNFPNIEDFDLWRRVSKLGKLYNLRSVVVHYRTHSGQVTIRRNQEIIFTKSKFILLGLNRNKNFTNLEISEFAKFLNLIEEKNWKRVISLTTYHKQRKYFIEFLFRKLIFKLLKICGQ
jgi:glycosyltransferase involved in cell wall biosynthesis